MSHVDNTELEKWASIPGYENYYEASNLGRVRSLPRMQKLWHGGKRLNAGCVLKSVPNSWGYHVVTLHNGGQKVWAVHILVARTFIGPCPDEKEVCHGNGDKSVNALWNLRYGTRQENSEDKALHGTALTGERNHFAKLTEADVAHIKTRIDTGDLQRVIAADFGVTQSAISKIKLGATW